MKSEIPFFALKVAMRCGVPATQVKNVIIWGNHSSTQYPDVHHCLVNISGSEVPCYDAVKDDAWLQGDFISVSWWSCLLWVKLRETFCRRMRLLCRLLNNEQPTLIMQRSVHCRRFSREAPQSSRPGSCPAPCRLPRPSVTTWETSGQAPLR